jgi:glucosamine--fructose-6-phosphate aminotransferase (isomerizing)
VTAQSGAATGKGDYKHFMLKEIYEQPAVIGDTLNSFINPATGHIHMPDDVMTALAKAPRLTLIACGTAFYACMIAKYWFEQIARVPCEIDIASEFRYREAPMPAQGVAIFVSQSGETLDTLEALRYCKRQGQTVLSIVNTIESTIERESDLVLHTLAGPEIGVASTKAFTTQATTLAGLALALAAKTGTIEAERLMEYTEALRHIPAAAAEVLQHAGPMIEEIAKDIAQARDMLYLGRGSFYPLALEGALKMKEISYIHAEGYASGEMKHGPIALIDEAVPVVVIAPGNDPLFDKGESNIQETVARGGQVLLLSDQAGAERLRGKARWILSLRPVHPFVAPILYALPIQLLAYRVAVAKGTDVDQPRNLAKSVTVE